MSELTADLFVSLDGFAYGVDVGPYFGYGGPELDEWIQAELDKPQVVVLGRVTYEALATISSNGSDRVSQRLAALPRVVVSSTLSEPLGVGEHPPRRWRCDRGAACGQGRQRRADANNGQRRWSATLWPPDSWTDCA